MVKTSVKNGFSIGSILAGSYYIIFVSLSYLLSYVMQQFPVGLHPVKILLTIPFVLVFFIGAPAIFLVNSLRPIGLNELLLSLLAGVLFILLGGLFGWFAQWLLKIIIGKTKKL